MVLLLSLSCIIVVCSHPSFSSEDAWRNRRAGAPTRAIHALSSSPFSLLPTVEAHCKVSKHYPLHSSPYSRDAWRNRRAGAPTRAIHALPSSLFPTLEAHCKVSKQYPLHSSPYSLLFSIRGPHSPLSPPTTYQRHNARLLAIPPTVNLQYAHAARHDAPRSGKEVDRRCQSTQPRRVIPLYTPQERRCRSRKQ